MKLLLAASLTTLICLAPAIAQGPPSSSPGSSTTEVTGCLSKAAGKYLISTSNGERLEVMGPAGLLDPQANKEVKITGEKENKDGKATFSATKVEMVSAACITKS